MVTKVVTGAVIKGFYALTILAGFSNRLCALIRKLADTGYLSLPEGVARSIDAAGTVLFFLLLGTFGVWIVVVFVKNLGALRGAGQVAAGGECGERPSRALDEAVAPSSRWVVDRRRLSLGMTGLVTFLGVLGLWLSPVIDGKTGLEWADLLFNQLTKSSIHFTSEGVRGAAKFEGVTVDLGVNPRWPGGDAQVARIVTANGMSAKVIGDSRVRIVGDLGLLAKAAAADAELLFTGNEQALRDRYGMGGREVIYYWWTAFEGLGRRYTQEDRPAEAGFVTSFASRVLEPSYNFAGIDQRDISQNVGIVTLLLSFYVLYTLWLGFSIMLVFEGFGIGTTKPGQKREV